MFYFLPTSSISRPTRNPTTWVYLRPRNERPCCPIPVYYAIRTGSIFLFRQIHRRVLSTLCPTNIRRCSPWLEGSFSLFFFVMSANLVLVARPLFKDRRSRVIRASQIKKSLCRNICVPMSVSQFLHYKMELTSMCIAVLTLCACTPPLDQVLQLWDFLLAFGVHLNVLCVIAQLLLMRDEVMSSLRCVIVSVLHVHAGLNTSFDHAAPCAFSEHFLPLTLYQLSELP